MTEKKKVRIAAIGDLHVRENSSGEYHELFQELSEKADVVVLCGDLTDHGLPMQAEILANELSMCRIPVVGVFGNHDFESNQYEAVKKILHDAKMIMLEDEEYIVGDVGFTGVKGFCGGYEKYMLGPFGESPIKHFVQAAVDETLKLESNLQRLSTKYKVVALHYSPIRDTIKGEPLEIYPFLGSSRLVEPIERFDVSVVFHGHANYGTPKGKTPKGIPVYNVALPLLRKISPKQHYALTEL